MTRSELVTRLHRQYPHLRRSEVARAVKTIFDDITNALICGDRVELRDFGIFSVLERAPRMGRNPRTGEEVQIGKRREPRFRTGKGLHAHINKET